MRLQHLIALLGSSPAAGLIVRAQPASVGLAVAAAPRCSACRCTEPENGDGDGGDLGDELNRLLDTPLLDPLQSAENEPKLLRDFKELFVRDREMAEAIYAGLVFAVLLFFSQKGVSLYKHCVFMPDNTCPWNAGSIDPLGF